MNRLFSALALVSLTAPFLTPTANAFSVSAREYSRHGIQLILNDQNVLSRLPSRESITAVEQVSRIPYQFDVKAGKCVLRVELSTNTPNNFIGTGFPHDPKVTDASGCQQ